MEVDVKGGSMRAKIDVGADKESLHVTMDLADKVSLGQYLRWLMAEGQTIEDVVRHNEIAQRFMQIVDEIGGTEGHGVRFANWLIANDPN